MTNNNAPAAIRVHGLRKSYGQQVVLDGIDFDVAQGSVFSLLGPNGAGKTTTVQILSTLIPADAGQVQVGGHDLSREPDAVRAAIGVTGQFSAVDKFLTGEENLILMADLRHMGKRAGRLRAAELLDQFDLADAARKAVAMYSGGMQRRLDLAMTLVGDPRIIFLDEPTAGLDPAHARRVFQVVRAHCAAGATAVIVTHDLDLALRHAGTMWLIADGRLAARGTPAEVLASAATRAAFGVDVHVGALPSGEPFAVPG